MQGSSTLLNGSTSRNSAEVWHLSGLQIDKKDSLSFNFIK